MQDNAVTAGPGAQAGEYQSPRFVPGALHSPGGPLPARRDLAPGATRGRFSCDARADGAAGEALGFSPSTNAVVPIVPENCRPAIFFLGPFPPVQARFSSCMRIVGRGV